MASSRSYLQYLLRQLTKVNGITYRPMMGEYLLLLQGKPFGGIYADRLFIRSVPTAEKLLPHAPRELPYAGAKKEMLLVEETDNAAFLKFLLEQMLPELLEEK
jgi:TfoX/Sxy family transcriptional regulator of competence genes